MIKRIIILAAIAIATLSMAPSSAESLCADAGARGLVPSNRLLPSGGAEVPVVCVPLP